MSSTFENYKATFQNETDNSNHQRHIEEFEMMMRAYFNEREQEIYKNVYDIFCRAVKDTGVELKAINLPAFRRQLEKEIAKTLSGVSFTMKVR